MALPYLPATPDKHDVRLRLVDSGLEIRRWISYQLSSNFLTPTDAWSMVVAGDDIPAQQRDAMRIGEEVRLYVDNNPLASGRIDSIEINAGRNGGTVFAISGRDKMAAVVDSVADPRMQFKDGTTLADFLKQLFSPYGWSSDEQFEIDNAANRDAKTGGIRSINTLTKKGIPKSAKALANLKLHMLKPHNNEGLYRFASRVAERFGLFIWCTADGEKVIVGSPDFFQEPKYQIRRNGNGTTNILDGSVKYDATDQPSVIIADGFSGGGEFGRGKTKAFCVNPYFGVDESGFIYDNVNKIVLGYPDAEQVVIVTQPFTRRAQSVPPRPVFLHDEESKSADELRFFVKRSMSELIRRSLVCHYTAEGLGQYVGGSFVPWDVDTVVDVRDEIAGLTERMYVLGRSFNLERGRTTTSLELVRLFSIAVPDEELVKKYLNAAVPEDKWVNPAPTRLPLLA